MIRKLAFNIANYIYIREHTTHAKRYGYYYVLQFLLLQGFEIIFTLLLSLLLGCFKEVIVVLLTVIFIRVKFGGIHAKTAKACLVLTTIIINLCGFLSTKFSVLINYPYIWILFSIGIAIFMISIINTRTGNKLFRRIESLIK